MEYMEQLLKTWNSVNTPSYATFPDAGDKFEVTALGVIKVTDAVADNAVVTVGKDVVLTAEEGTLRYTITVKSI